MKKIIVLAIILAVSIGPLFKGLFFPYEMYAFFSVLSILCGIYFFLKIKKNEKLFVKDWSIYLGLVLILSYCLAFINAVNVRGNIETTIQVFVYFIVFLVVFDYFRENKDKVFTLFILPITSAGLIAALAGLAGYTKVFSFLNETLNSDRLGSTMQYANTAAIYFLINIVLILSVIINTDNIYYKSLLAGVGNIFLMALFFTSSRGAFLLLPIIIFLVFFLSMPKGSRFNSAVYIICLAIPVFTSLNGFYANSKIMNLVSASKWILLSAGLAASLTFLFSLLPPVKFNRKYTFAAAAVICTAAAAVIFYKREFLMSAISSFIISNVPQNVFKRVSDINMQTNSVVIRFEFDKDALKLIRDNWLFGLGGGGFASLYQSVQSKYYAAKLVHNHYLQIFTEAGILGFFSFIFVTVRTCYNFIYTRIKTADNRSKVYIAAFFASFLSLAFHSAIDFNLSFGSISLIYWSLIGISASYLYTEKNKVTGDIAVDEASKAFIKPVYKVIPAMLIVLSLVLSAVSSIYTVSSYYAEQGVKYKKDIAADEAIKNYSKASKLDPLNASHHAELADIYSWMAYTSETEQQKNSWIKLAVTEGERAIMLDSYYPYYNKILTDIYFNGGMSEKACEQAIKLVSVQPHVSTNYELLARGYMEAGLLYLKEKNIEKGKDYIMKCSVIDDNPDVKATQTIVFYKGKALLLLGDFNNAKTQLNKSRNGTLELKMDSDRLLYIINEETGKDAENAKYKGVPWMGAVKLTPVYKDIKQILSEGLLK